MAPNASWKSFLGVAKEVTKGTAVVPSDYIRVKDFKPKRTPTILPDEGWQGSAVETYGSQQGKVHTEWSVPDSPLYVDTFGWWLKSLLGDEAISGAGPYAHVFSTLNSGQPPALTLTDFFDIEARAWPGNQVSEVKLSIDPDGNIMYSASGKGFPEASASTPTASHTALKPLAGWLISANIAGVAAQLSKLDVTISRAADPIKTTNGSQNPTAVFTGRVSVKVSGTAMAESNAHLEALKADTQGVFSLTGTRGSGATTEAITVTCTTAAYEGVEIDRSGDWIAFPVNLTAHANATDAGASGGKSPIKITLTNAKSAVY